MILEHATGKAFPPENPIAVPEPPNPLSQAEVMPSTRPRITGPQRVVQLMGSTVTAVP